MFKAFLFSLIFLWNFTGTSTPKYYQQDIVTKCVKCNDELEEIIAQIKEKVFLSGATLNYESRGVYYDNNTKSKIVWQGSVNYCNGQCTSIISVHENCVFGICWYKIKEDPVTTNCPCGTFCPCVFVN